MQINIRAAIPDDLKAIYALIKELANFENEPNEPSTTFKQFNLDFKESFECIIAETDNNVVGIALYFFGYSTWKGRMLYLDDLVVKENYRQHKIGSKLFNTIMKIANAEKVGQVRWQVLDWNKPAIKMYKKVNADFYTDWWTCKLEKDKIENYIDL